MKKKFVIVCYPVGRVGSSAMMGLLSKFGLSLGPADVKQIKGKHNPKGFFESTTHNKFLKSAYPDIFSEVNPPPTIEELVDQSTKATQQFVDYIEENYNENTEYCIKSPWSLTLPIWKNLNQVYDCKFIYISRDIHQQAISLERIWKQRTDGREDYANSDFLHPWLDNWNEFCRSILNKLDLEFHEVSYEDLMNEKVKTAHSIATFLGKESLNDHTIDSWLERNNYNGES